MRSLVLALLLCGLLVAGLPAAAARAAETVAVRAGIHADYGRIVFDWPREVGYQARIDGDRLVITFDEAAAFEGPLLQRGLRGYAEAPQLSEDGRRLTLALSAAHGLKHFRLGNKVVVDLQQAAAAATEPEPTPATAAPAAKPSGAADAPPRVRLRAGRHSGYSRLVFDWPAPVGSVLEETPGRARIVFDRPADFDTSAVRPSRLPQIAGLAADRDGVSLDIAEGSRLRVTRSGTKVVVDVYAPAPDQPVKTAPAEPAKQAPAPPDLAEAEPAAPKAAVVDHSPRPDAPAREPAAQPLAAKPAGAPPKRLEAAAAPVAPQPRKAPEKPEEVKAAESKTAESKMAESRTAEPKQVPAATGPAAPAPTSLVPQVMGGTVTPPAKAPAPATPGAAAGDAKAPARPAEAAQYSAPDASRSKLAAPIPDGARASFTIRTEPTPSFIASRAQGPKADAFVPVVMTFAWDRPTAAAAFRRGESLWLVFDRPAPRDVVRRIATVAPHLGEVRLMEDEGSTILIIGAVPSVAPRLSREDSGWTVDLRPRSALPERGLAAPVVEKGGENAKGNARVRFPVIGAGRMLWVTDPDAGDRLVLVPTRGAGMGLALPYGFPQFRSLQTQQGIVLQPLTAGIEVATIRSGVLVRDRNGLLVSKEEERRDARRAESQLAQMPGLFDLPAWRRGGVEQFQDNRQALQRAMNGLQGERLGIARLELARFFFAHGFGSEALGSIRVIEEQNPRLAQDPEIRLMKGASQVMMDDFRGATVSLAHPALVGEREALLWQAALATQAEDWQAAATGFAAALDLIADYPENLRMQMNLAAAEAFLQAGDIDAATLQIGALLRETLDDRQAAQVKVVQGALELAKENPELARKLWSDARDGPHRPSQARARLALIDLGMSEGTLSSNAAIAELERLRFAWRGDYFEFTLLRKLADLYVEEDRHREALYALREAASNFPDGPAARNAAQRMREIFAEIYRGPGDPEVPPLRALALYQEFTELTPGGPEGDRMIAALADRLVEVDLLDRAAELLEGQVRYRLEGPEKARIGARLALVHLLDRQPEAGLEALDVSEVEDLPGELVLQRRQLRARAFSDLGRSTEALKLLEGDNSLDAEHLRADIHWRQRQWPEAVTSLSKLIPLLPPRRPMEEDESQLVVNLAVSLMLSGQSVELEDLDRRYGAAMAKGPHADTFKLLVGDGEKVAVTSIADQLSKVGQAQDFMSNYRERLRQGELSQVN